MKKLTFIGLLISLSIIGSSCNKDKDSENSGMPTCEPYQNNCFKGRLEINDICGNYTIKVIEGNINPALIHTSWKHPKTNITYTNVFSLGNICSFPTTLKQGDEFYFQIKDNKKDASCVQCLAYVPTPEKILSITVSNTPCMMKTN